MTKPLTSDEFRAIYSKVPRLTVEVVVKTPKGLLLTKRAIEPYKGQWHSPGGTVYQRENLEQAVKRVAREELGVDVRVGELLGKIEYASEQGIYFGHSISLAFMCEIISGEPTIDEQASEVRFFESIPRNTLPEQRDYYSQALNMPIAGSSA